MQANLDNVALSRTTSTGSASKAVSNTFASLSSIDLSQLKSLLQGIATANPDSVLLQPDLDQLQSMLASGGIEIEDTDALRALAHGVAADRLSTEDIDDLINLISGIQSLPLSSRQQVGEQLLSKATTLVDQYLTDRSLNSEQVASAKLLQDAISSAQLNQEELTTALQSLVDSSPAGQAKASNLAPLVLNNGDSDSVPMLQLLTTTPTSPSLAPSFNTTAIIANYGNGNIDPIMQAMIILFGFINSVQVPTLQSYENNYLGIQKHINAISSGQSGLLEVTQFMAANTAATPLHGINVFAALEYYLFPDTVPEYIIPHEHKAFYNSFVESCPLFIAALDTAYNKFLVATGFPSVVTLMSQIAAGDTPEPTLGTVAITHQAEIMIYFIQEANSAGYNISGMTSSAVYSKEWTNNTVAGVEKGKSELYIEPPEPPLAAGNVMWGHQLTFNATTVNKFIGSGGSGQSGTGALGIMSQTLTNGSTTSNMVQSVINAITQSISGIWTLIGQSLIPADKFPG